MLKAKHPKKASPTKPKTLIFGAAGVGKTWTALDFPSVYFIDVEGGASLPHYTDRLVAAGGSYLGPEDGANDFGTVLDQVRSLQSERHEYQTLVIDSISKLYNDAAFDASLKVGDEFGRDKKEAQRTGLRPLLQLLGRLDMNVVLVAHEAAKWEGGEQVGYKADCWEKVDYDLHLVLRILKRGAKRFMSPIKSRLERFEEGALYPWSFDEFADRYGREIIAAPVSPIEVVTKDDLRTLRALIAETASEDLVPKILHKAKVSDLQDLTAEQASAVIESLKKKAK